MPDHFINIVIRLHENASVMFKVGDGDDVSVSSTIGVRQGSCEGPTLFLFIMQAALETMEWPVDKPQFCRREDGKSEKLTGVRPFLKQGVTTFDMWASLFADDCGLLFNSREDLITGANYIYQHLKKFGLTMHIERGATASKTEAVFFPAARKDSSSGDQSDIAVDGDGFISFSTEFKYLGSIVHNSLKPDADIDYRISKATSAFGALRKCFFNDRRANLAEKGRVFTTLIPTILLYGSESWCLRQDSKQRLRVFFNNCVRSICRVTVRQVYRHRISNEQLQKRLGIKDFDYYYDSRMLRWAGHVARMKKNRLPRQLLTAWVRHKRPVGAPQMTYGKTLKKVLATQGLPTTFAGKRGWAAIAQNRVKWKQRAGLKAAGAINQ